MIKWLISIFRSEETNTINPNSLSPLPPNKFFNYLIQKADVDEDDEKDQEWNRGFKAPNRHRPSK